MCKSSKDCSSLFTYPTDLSRDNLEPCLEPEVRTRRRRCPPPPPPRPSRRPIPSDRSGRLPRRRPNSERCASCPIRCRPNSSPNCLTFGPVPCCCRCCRSRRRHCGFGVGIGCGCDGGGDGGGGGAGVGRCKADFRVGRENRQSRQKN